MSHFFKGLFAGIGLSLLFAPMPGQQLRGLLRERFQGLTDGQPEKIQLPQRLQDAAQERNQLLSTPDTLKDDRGHAILEEKKQTNHSEDTVQLPNPLRKQREQAIRETSNQSTPPVQPITQREAAEVSSPEIVQDDSLTTLPDMTPGTRRRLEAVGVQNLSQLLEQTKTKEERSALANKTGIGERTLRAFVYRADLMRLTGIGEEMATLLEEAGVNGCKDLQHRNPEHLYAKLEEVQANRNSSLPDAEELSTWIMQARQITQ